jgi:hypothetical protein
VSKVRGNARVNDTLKCKKNLKVTQKIIAKRDKNIAEGSEVTLLNCLEN